MLVTEKAVSPHNGATTYLLVDDQSFEPDSVALQYMMALRGAGRSPHTIRAYLPRIAGFLNWCSVRGIDWTKIGITDMVRYKVLLEDAMTPRGALRTGKTVNAALTAVCEFLRFAAAHGHADEAVASRLTHPRFLNYTPGAFDSGESGRFRNVRSRALRAPEIELAPELFSAEEEQILIAGGSNARDRFLLAVMLGSGMRIGEALGLHREDLHMLPDSRLLGCTVKGAHVHIRPRTDNANGARVKGGRSRIVPLPGHVIERYSALVRERGDYKGDGSNFVFINRVGKFAGQPMSYSNAKQIIERIGKRYGFRARPHMTRHTTATRWIREGTAPDVVQALLGHVSQASTQIYVHASQQDMRQAVDRLSAQG